MKFGDTGTRFQWSQQLQGLILSSYNFGSIFSEIPSGILAQKYGAKLILLIGIFLSAIVSATTPLAILFGSYNNLHSYKNHIN